MKQIKDLAKETISNPPCKKTDDYRVAVYQALLDTIDLLPDPAMRREEYQELLDFMLERREYIHWVAMAAVMCSKNALGLRLTKDAFNAALNGSSLEDANRMEDRNQSLIIANGITEGMAGLG